MNLNGLDAALIIKGLEFLAGEVSKGALGEIGKGVWDQLKDRSKELWQKVHDFCRGDSRAEMALMEFQDQPEQKLRRQALADEMERLSRSHPQQAVELAEILKRICLQQAGEQQASTMINQINQSGKNIAIQNPGPVQIN